MRTWWTIAAGVVGLALAGCGRLSPYVGTWSGEAKAVQSPGGGILDQMKTVLVGSTMNGPAALTLRPDGTGFMKVASAPEKPVGWREEGDKLIITSRDASGANEKDGTLVGTLGPDKRTLSIDLGPAKADLTKVQ